MAVDDCQWQTVQATPMPWSPRDLARCRFRLVCSPAAAWLQVGEYQGAYKVLDAVFTAAAWRD